jgi:hypothetical protein
MLRYAQTLEVNDPRDRINATLNLAIDYDDDGTTMDYEKSLTDMYTGVARLLPFKCNSLQFLAQARLSRNPDPSVKDLPSWAPNWNPPGNAGYFWAPFRAAGDLPMYSWPFQEDIRDGILHVRGFQHGTVEQTLSNMGNPRFPLSVLFGLFLSTVKSSTVVHTNVIKLASALVGPSLVELQQRRRYFSKAEKIVYMSILLGYASVTPGLRITDLLPYAVNMC